MYCVSSLSLYIYMSVCVCVASVCLQSTTTPPGPAAFLCFNLCPHNLNKTRQAVTYFSLIEISVFYNFFADILHSVLLMDEKE